MKRPLEPPADPRQFISYLCVNYIESTGSDQASTLFSHIIELDTTIDNNGFMILTGKASPHTHPAFRLPLDQHPYFVALSIVCRNKHKLFKDEIWWRKYLSPKQMKEVMEEGENKHCKVVGDVQKLPHAPEVTVHLTLAYEKPKGHHIDQVYVKFPLSIYFDFYDRMTQ